LTDSPTGAGANDAHAPALLSRFGSPLYVYDEATLRARCRALRAAVPLPDVAFLYATKANTNPALLAIVREEGLGVDAVSLGEADAALRAGFPAARISYNGNNVTSDELAAVLARGVHVSVDSAAQLERAAALAPGAAFGLRVNPDVGDGHHAHVITGGPESKFGVSPAEVPALVARARTLGVRIDGLHQHIGSGILDVANLLRAVDVLLAVAPAVPDLRFVDFGGGFGVPYRPHERALDLPAFGAAAAPKLADFRRRLGRAVEFRFEPGRYVVAECGTLYVTVTAVKRAARHVFVGVDSGFNHLVRPTMYGSYHPIRNVTRPHAPLERVAVAGYVCESGDLFAKDRELPSPQEGDVLAIGVAGAYGYSMASTYNTRGRPAEILVATDGSARLIRRRETLEDLARLDV
jgi:diaminopimelate decarboxylase